MILWFMFFGGGEMKAVRIQRFGGPDQVTVEDVPVPVEGTNEILVQVMAAGVAPWDALIREGQSKVSPQPPLTLGSDLAGVVEAVGAEVVGLSAGDEVYGVTNPQFCGAQAEYAVTQAGMIAPKPKGLDFLAAASAPVIAVAAWQMLFEYAKVKSGDAVMILGAAGNVGAYAVQMALNAGVGIVAVARARDERLLHSLGSKTSSTRMRQILKRDCHPPMQSSTRLARALWSGVLALSGLEAKSFRLCRRNPLRRDQICDQSFFMPRSPRPASTP
jgi:NADPH:quinone reductase-like Zn-dependent oxidoreductase